jgi:TPR repeat protein
MLKFLLNRKKFYSTAHEVGLKHLENKKYKEALKSFSFSKNPKSFKKIAELHLNGVLSENGEPNHEQALKYFQTAYEMGDLESLTDIGFFFFFNSKEIFTWKEEMV